MARTVAGGCFATTRPLLVVAGAITTWHSRRLTTRLLRSAQASLHEGGLGKDRRRQCQVENNQNSSDDIFVCECEVHILPKICMMNNLCNHTQKVNNLDFLHMVHNTGSCRSEPVFSRHTRYGLRRGTLSCVRTISTTGSGGTLVSPYSLTRSMSSGTAASSASAIF